MIIPEEMMDCQESVNLFLPVNHCKRFNGPLEKAKPINSMGRRNKAPKDKIEKPVDRKCHFDCVTSEIEARLSDPRHSNE